MKVTPKPFVSPTRAKSSDQGSVESVVSDLPEVNLELSKFPSKSLSYPENSKVLYRPFRFGEVKKISQSKLDTRENFEFILQGITTSFDKLDLTLPDFLYAAFYRKLSTLGGSKFFVPYICPKCKKQTKATAETDKLDFADIKAPELPVTATLSFGECSFTPMTVRDLFTLMDIGKQKDEVAMYTMQCRAFNGEPVEDFEEMYELIDNASYEDGRVLAQVDSYLEHSLKPLKNKCKNKVPSDDKKLVGKKPETVCGHEVSIDLEGGESLILPFRDDKKSDPSPIKFGD